MTSNQIAYQQHLETQRSNLARERETNRSNLATETETKRANIARESEDVRYHNLTTNETNRHNLATEAETKRHNLFGEQIAENTLAETKRSNMVKEAETQRSNMVRETETHRSNVASESNDAVKAAASYLGAQAASTQAAASYNESSARIPLIMAQVGTETQKSINFGSQTKLNLARVNESRSQTQLNDARRKTENQQRLPGTIGSWLNVGVKALQGVKLFGGK